MNDKKGKLTKRNLNRKIIRGQAFQRINCKQSVTAKIEAFTE